MTSMIGSHSQFLTLRGLRLHLRSWGAEDARPLVLVHGYLDCSATFTDFAELLVAAGWRVLAPDLRGFGLSGWAPEGYWFPDYLADLDAWFGQFSPEASLPLIGHSLGAQVAAAYAGARPARVSQLVCLDGPTVPRNGPAETMGRLRQWLEQQRGADVEAVSYASYPAFARRLMRLHPQLDAERAEFVARCWALETEDGRVRLRADPRHRLPFPVSYREEDFRMLWGEVRAPTLFVDGSDSALMKHLGAPQRLDQVACFASAQRVVIPGAGHMLHLDAPQDTARQVLNFLAG